MASFVNATAGVVKIIGHVMDIVEDVHEMAGNDNQTSNIHCASTIYKVSLLTLKCFQSIAGMSGASTETMLTFKNVEQVVATVGMPVELYRKMVVEMQKPEEERSLLGIIEKVILYPAVEMARLSNEQCQLQEQRYLEIVAKDANATRPIYGYNSEGEWVEKGCKKIDPSECRNAIQSLKKNEPYLNAAEAFFQLENTSKIYSVLANQIIHLARQRPNFPFPPIVVNGQDNQNNPGRVERGEEPDALDLLSAHKIPQKLHGDSFFSQHTCAISFEPIRFPVKDPTKEGAENPTYYDYENILKWVRTNHTSPVTRRPLSEQDLAEAIDTDLQRLIEQRLQAYQPGIDQFVADLVASKNRSAASASSSASASASASAVSDPASASTIAAVVASAAPALAEPANTNAAVVASSAQAASSFSALNTGTLSATGSSS